MTPKDDGTFLVEYGRVGGTMQRCCYSLSQWDKKYAEKIRKGYVDQTDLMLDLVQHRPSATNDYKPIEDEGIRTIVERLRGMARQAIQDNYTVSAQGVTKAMIEAAEQALAELILIGDLNEFNSKLTELFSIIPRKMSRVADHLAKDKRDFGRIIESEQDLLDVMKGQVYIPEAPVETDNEDTFGQTILEANGLVFEPVTDEEIRNIKRHLGTCADKYHDAWRVVNTYTQKAFDDYMVAESNPEIKLLWHGSRNENWWSIINMGLVLKPTNAVITGKMFGYGTYFATKARKSLGYTSLSGSYWARGHSKTAFMAVYKVAYGKPYDVYCFDSRYHSMNYDRLQELCPGAHCLHAHEGAMLRNDEIIVYKECQTTIRYLVELKER